MMNELGKAVKLAIEAWKKERADGGDLEDGDSFVAIFGNCCLYVSLEDGKLKTEFMADMPVKIDMSLKIYD